MDPTEGATEVLVDLGKSEPLESLAVSPDGLRLAWSRAGRVEIWDLSKKALQWQAEVAPNTKPDRNAPPPTLQWSPGGSRLAWWIRGNQAAGLKVWTLGSGEPALLAPGRPLSSPEWMPGGEETLIALQISNTPTGSVSKLMRISVQDGSVTPFEGAAPRINRVLFLP
jgi:WD40 repeat protein